MKEIKAFVGHSFAKDDATIIRSFIDYFANLSELHPNFSWQHAEGAEPKELAEKILTFFEGKNTFIGICTQKERVFKKDFTPKLPFFGKTFKCNDSNFEWKTSDWVIQEIGLAKGRNLALILFIESGVRKPGGLQGDIEYIEFDRANPEKAFGKFLQMITSLTPKNVSGAVSGIGAQPTSDTTVDDPKLPPEDDWTPRSSWIREDFEMAIMRMIAVSDSAGEEIIDKAYLATPDALLNDNKTTWEARKEYMRLVFTRDGSLPKLKQMALANPDNFKTWEYLALGLTKYQEHKEAAMYYEAAAAKTSSTDDKARLLGKAAVAFTRAGVLSSAYHATDQIKAYVQQTGKGETDLLKVLKQISDILKQDTVSLALMERMLDNDPSDIDTRFTLAFKHHEVGNDDLAFFHYSRIPPKERNPVTWNNLGVAYDSFDLTAKAVSAFQRAEEAGETLATSNLAKKLISVGFLSEAQKKCEEALKIENYHENILHYLSEIRSQPEEEDKKVSEILEKAEAPNVFYADFGRALSLSSPSTINAKWQETNCAISVTITGTKFIGIGTYDLPPSGLASAILSFGSIAAASQLSPIKYRVEYSGVIRGRTIEGYVTRETEEEFKKPKTILGGNENRIKALMIISDDGIEIRVMENNPGNPRFSKLTRI